MIFLIFIIIPILEISIFITVGSNIGVLNTIAIILITHIEIHARFIADRFTFLSLVEVIGTGLSSELGGDDVKRLMAGGAEICDLAKEL